MKTIEERALEYANRLKQLEYDYFFELNNTYNFTRLYREEIAAYEKGALEQKIIDDEELLKFKSAWEKEAQTNHNGEANYKQGYHDAVEKACELLKEVGVLTDDDSIMGFIKAMEE